MHGKSISTIMFLIFILMVLLNIINEYILHQCIYVIKDYYLTYMYVILFTLCKIDLTFDSFQEKQFSFQKLPSQEQHNEQKLRKKL